MSRRQTGAPYLDCCRGIEFRRACCEVLYPRVLLPWGPESAALMGFRQVPSRIWAMMEYIPLATLLGRWLRAGCRAEL